MELVILGSGSAFAPRRPKAAVRNAAANAVVLDGRIMLFDLGFGAVRQMARAGLDPARVTDVFISHRHPDHVGDLAALLFFLRYEARPRSRRLRLWGPRDFARFLHDLRGAYRPWLSPRGYRLEVEELSAGRDARGADWRVAARSVPHPTPALAYRLSYKRKSFVYSGDAGYDPGLADFAAEADLFLLECTLSSLSPAAGHLTPPLALATLGASACRRGLLTHLSERSEAELRALVRGRRRVGLARDLLRIAI